MRATQRMPIIYSSGLSYNRQYFRTHRQWGLHLSVASSNFSAVWAISDGWVHINLVGSPFQVCASRTLTNAPASSVGNNRENYLHCVFSCPVGNACEKRLQFALSNIQSLSEHVKDGKEIFGTPSKCLRLPTFRLTLHV